ncbi:hypothetical protein [Bradyrhizobium sp. SZCCHNS3053]|uniref:hypothetical protein n=1 Tax=Bradyrhizobium sp. SZCCHNS3053 TaxID=3057322 RepID=UPI002916987E|nr:hypothetical protein [Bradyrhizobium sp. SZCCHNS3053]
MDPTANDPFRYIPEDATSVPTEPVCAVCVVPPPPLDGEVLPPEAPVVEAQPVPAVLQYPVGIIDFNKPILVVDNGDDDAEPYDSPSIVTVLKGNAYPVVVSFWHDGEQRIDQFDTDGDSFSGDVKIEQDQPWPRTVYVVIARDGRHLVLDETLYSSEEQAHDDNEMEDVIGIFPIVVQGPQADEPAVEEPAAEPESDPVFATVSGSQDVGVELTDDEVTEEEPEEEEGLFGQPAGAPAKLDNPGEPPTEVFVAGRMRRVGDTVYARRGGWNYRECRVTKLRHDAAKALCLQPTDNTPAYWAWNSHVRT